jgi:hypothetical protein
MGVCNCTLHFVANLEWLRASFSEPSIPVALLPRPRRGVTTGVQTIRLLVCLKAKHFLQGSLLNPTAVTHVIIKKYPSAAVALGSRYYLDSHHCILGTWVLHL